MECKNDNIPISALISIIKQQHTIFTNKILEEEGISAGQTPYLIYLLFHEKACQEDIAKHYKRDKGVVARGIRKLEEKNLIYKEIDENNRRKSVLSLNEEGKRIAKRIIEINKQWENAFCNELNMSRERVCDVLEQIAQKTIENNKELIEMEDSNG